MSRSLSGNHGSMSNPRCSPSRELNSASRLTLWGTISNHAMPRRMPFYLGREHQRCYRHTVHKTFPRKATRMGPAEITQTFALNLLGDPFIQSYVQMRRIIEAIRPSREQKYTSVMTSLSQSCTIHVASVFFF